ncbi:MAG TPA: ribosome assembly factor SBDS [Candidatus Nanoarchaeia archaeon]|nr:ribosome assembly factor SBDS [Candidatus Nanoarchaeia archaeon]
MVDVDKAVLARIDRNGQHFEILVDCDKALEFKRGKQVAIRDIVAVDDVFKDVKKGEKASLHDVQKIFGTGDIDNVFRIIVREGHVQLTTKHLAKDREEKKKQVINIIHRNAVDPKTGYPHPPQRIEAAMTEAKVKIDENKSAEEQVEEILRKLRPIIPIKFEVKEIQAIVPPQHSARAFPVAKKYKVLHEEWMNDGSLKIIVEVPAGIQEELFSELNKATHGEIDLKVMRTR